MNIRTNTTVRILCLTLEHSARKVRSLSGCLFSQSTWLYKEFRLLYHVDVIVVLIWLDPNIWVGLFRDR